VGGSCRFHLIGGVADHLPHACSDGNEVVLRLGELTLKLLVVVSEFGVGGVEFSVGF
jgi:hypothetical protein